MKLLFPVSPAYGDDVEALPRELLSGHPLLKLSLRSSQTLRLRGGREGSLQAIPSILD